ncbi:hypothetical protein MMC10_004233 [Thelotrema lepadinum]|nr:hypothetical protein [Thelotrema lepadinum]
MQFGTMKASLWYSLILFTSLHLVVLYALELSNLQGLDYQAQTNVEALDLSLQLSAARTSNLTLSGKIRRQEDGTFQQCLINGVCLLSTLKLGEGPLSTYTQYSDLASSGWTEVGTSNLAFPSLGTLLTKMKWVQADFQPIYWKYSQPWKYRDATYTLWVNTKAGAIIATDVDAPIQPFINPDGPAPALNPPLTHLSDFMFLVFQNLCSSQQQPLQCIQNLQYVIHYDVVNPTCMEMASTALSNNIANGYPQYPGPQFTVAGPYSDPNTQWAKVFIGCPNGYGLAYMLSQFRNKFGPKTISDVNVFGYDGDAARLCIMYSVVQNY